LEIYCTSVVAMRRTQVIMAASPEGSPRYEETARLYRREAAMVVKLGKVLRIGPRHDRTKMRAVSSLPKPWDLGGASGAPAPVNEFRGWDVAPRERGDDEPPPDDGAA
jgi:hypothetical protein